MSNEEIQKMLEKLEDHDRRLAELEKLLETKKALPVVKDNSTIEKLSEKLHIPEERFAEIYDIEEDTLTVVNYVGTDVKAINQNIVILTLYGYKIYFDIDEVLSQEIRRNVIENRISVNNFSEYLNELIPYMLRRKGKTRSPNTSYKLTLQGEVRAKDLIQQIIKDPDESESR